MYFKAADMLQGEFYSYVFIPGLKMGQISLIYLIMLLDGATQSVFLLNNLFKLPSASL